MSIIFKLFCEEIAGVDDTRYLFDFDDAFLVGLKDAGLMEINVLCALEGEGQDPITGRLVIIADDDAFGCVGKAEVDGVVLFAVEVVDAFMHGIDFRNTGAVCCFILHGCFQSNGAASMADKIA